MIGPCPLCKRDQKLEKLCIFISLDLGHLALVGDFELSKSKTSQILHDSKHLSCPWFLQWIHAKVTSSPFPHFASVSYLCIFCLFSLLLKFWAKSITIKEQFTGQILLTFLSAFTSFLTTLFFMSKPFGTIVIIILQMLLQISDIYKVTCLMLSEFSC